MRILASLLAAILLATGLALGGYCALLAWRRDAIAPPPATPADDGLLAALPRPQPLAPGPEFARGARAANAAIRGARAPAIALTLRIRNLPAGWLGPDAGVAVAAANGNPNLTWTPLAAPSSPGGDVLLEHTVPVAGDHVITVAARREFAVHGYLARTLAAVPPGGTTVDVDASAARIAFELPPQAGAATIVRLVRTDDPHWLPGAGAPSGVRLQPRTTTWLWLGAGRYDLCDPLQPERRQHFDVPGAATIVVNVGLPRARADRP
jgi:hypothetical protein